MNSIKHGPYMKYKENGRIVYQSIFNKDRETTIYSRLEAAPKINGFKNGYHKAISYKDGSVIREGEYWQGYKIGKHIQ